MAFSTEICSVSLSHFRKNVFTLLIRGSSCTWGIFVAPRGILSLYLVVEEKVDKARYVLGELSQLAHSLHSGALAAVENMHPNLLVRGGTIDELGPHQAVLSLPERVHVMDDKGLQEETNRQGLGSGEGSQHRARK